MSDASSIMQNETLTDFLKPSKLASVPFHITPPRRL